MFAFAFELLLWPRLWLRLCLVLLVASSLTVAQTTNTTSGTTSPTSTTSSSTSTISIPILPTLISLPPLNASSRQLRVSIPPSPSSPLYITLNLCQLTSNTSLIPAVRISTLSPPSFDVSRTVADSGSGGVGMPNRRARGNGVWELSWDGGFANWTITDTGAYTYTDAGEANRVEMMIGLGVQAGGSLQAGMTVESGNMQIQLGVSADAPLHALSSATPLLGDTTSSQALLFSDVFLSSPQIQPGYPNYTLPPAEFPIPSLPTNFSAPDLSLIVLPTSPSSSGLVNSYCAISAANSSGGMTQPQNMVVNSTTQWTSAGHEEGFRTYWVVGGLADNTNYTAWITNGVEISPPIYLSTKEASFPCQLVLPSPLCPMIGYAAPLEPNSTSVLDQAAPLTSFSPDLSSLLTSSLQSFSTSLLTMACGRDFYSHVSSCLDCYTAYRDWLCRTVVPQCASTITSSKLDRMPAIVQRTTSTPRSALAPPAYDYTELLPCLSTCNAVDRTCPAFLTFRCPLRGITANQSYGYVGNEDGSGDGSGDGGTWLASDRWGNRWCNG